MGNEMQIAQNLRETLAKVREVIAAGPNAELAKAFVQAGTATSGITAYDLEMGARLLYPVTTILRNMIPRRVGGNGIQANWRSITAINPSSITIGRQEGKRGGVVDQTTTDNFAKFAFLGMDNNASWEAQYAAEGFDDILALTSTILLQSAMEAEEKVIIGGNATTALADTGTITATPGTGGSLAHAALFVGCAALTYEGYISAVAPGATGVTVPYTRTNADGSTTAISGFFSKPATHVAATIPSAGSGKITASVPSVNGAWGYAWYVGLTGAEKFVAVTSGPSVVISALPSSGNQLYSALGTSNVSTDTLVYDGLFAQAFAGGGYISHMGNTPLTNSGGTPGTVDQFDTAIYNFFSKYRLIPTHIFISGADQANIKGLILHGNTNAAPFFQGESGEIRAGARVRTYTNPIGFGNTELQLVVHPFIPQGTVLFYSDRVPYALTNVQDIVKMNLRRDYAAIRWPMTKPVYEYGVYWDGVLQHYFPLAMGVINEISLT